MKIKTVKVLPKTASEIANGGLYLQRVRCGKANCKCSRGESHAGYYFFTRRNGKLVKFYIRRAEVEAFTALASEASAERLQRRKSAKESNQLLRRLRESIREYERLTKLHNDNNLNEQR